MHGNGHIRIDGARLPLRLLLFCLLVEVALVVADAFLNYGGLLDSKPLRRVFNIAREDGLATWFMVLQTFVAGCVLALLALLAKAGGEARQALGWAFLSAFFIYMSADDAAEIHERLGSTFKGAARRGEDGATLTELQALFPSYDWQLVVLPVFVACGVFMLWFLYRRMRERTSLLMLVAAVGCMGSAVVIDFFEGLGDEHPWNVLEYLRARFDASDYTVSHFARSLEEFLEMCGISLLLALFTRQLVAHSGTALSVHFDGGGGAPPRAEPQSPKR